MAKQLVYQGCQGKDAALIEWGEQIPGSPTSYKTTLTPVKVFVSPPNPVGGEFSIYQYYELYYRYSVIDYEIVNGIPEPFKRTEDNNGSPLGDHFYIYGAPSNLRKVFDRTTPDGVDVYIWTLTVDGVNYDYIYNEITEQYEQVDIPYQHDAGLIQTFTKSLPSGKTYGEVEILEIYFLDSEGNRLELGGGANQTTWKLTVESSIDGTYEETFSITFQSEPQDIRVDCDQCSNKCIKVASDDRKRFACICREKT